MCCMYYVIYATRNIEYHSLTFDTACSFANNDDNADVISQLVTRKNSLRVTCTSNNDANICRACQRNGKAGYGFGGVRARVCVWRHWALTGDFIESYKNKIITEKNNQLRPLRQRIEWCMCSVLVYKCLHDRRSTNRPRRNVQVAPVSIHLHLSTEVISSVQHMAIWQYLAPVAYKEIPRCFALSLFLVPLCGTHCPAADGASLTLTHAVLCALEDYPILQTASMTVRL